MQRRLESLEWRSWQEVLDLVERWYALLSLYEREPVDPALLDRYLWWEGLTDAEGAPISRIAAPRAEPAH